MRKGYSLIEMMVVISVTVVLSSVLLAYNRSTERQLVVYRDQELLISVLNRVKALAVKRLNAEDTCAFGVRLDPTSQDVIIFKDSAPEGTIGNVFACRDNTGNYMSNFTYDGETEKLETISFHPTVSLSLKNQSGDISDPLDIIFVPPNPTVVSSVHALPILAKLHLSDDSFATYVEISPAGQITGHTNAPF